MPILTQFMEPMKPDTGHEIKIKAFGDRLTSFVAADKTLRNEGIRPDREVMGSAVLRIFKEAWNDIGYIPARVGDLDLTQFSGYGYLSSAYGTTLASYSLYPSVRLHQIKDVAEKMGFVIVPLSYTNSKKMFEPYEDLNSNYYCKLCRSYDSFYHTIDFINHIFNLEESDAINRYQIYVIAPLAFYNPWLEVSSEEDTLPKFFSSQLSTIETLLGLIIPTQKNLYTMSKTNSENIRLLDDTMQENFSVINKTIASVSERLAWVEHVNQVLSERVNSLEGELTRTQLKTFELERKVACMLDPIIFAVPPKTDISSSSSDNIEARVGLCFGPEMPVDVFVTNGLVKYNNKAFKDIQLPLPLQTLSV